MSRPDNNAHQRQNLAVALEMVKLWYKRAYPFSNPNTRKDVYKKVHPETPDANQYVNSKAYLVADKLNFNCRQIS